MLLSQARIGMGKIFYVLVIMMVFALVTFLASKDPTTTHH
jgi:hypothetical protein